MIGSDHLIVGWDYTSVATYGFTIHTFTSQLHVIGKTEHTHSAD